MAQARVEGRTTGNTVMGTEDSAGIRNRHRRGERVRVLEYSTGQADKADTGLGRQRHTASERENLAGGGDEKGQIPTQTCAI